MTSLIIILILLVLSILIATQAAVRSPERWSDTWGDKLYEIGLTFVFAIPGMWLSMMVMTWLENLGPQWAYDIAGVMFLLTAASLWNIYIRYRRWALKLD